jgi:hypothetical protein
LKDPLKDPLNLLDKLKTAVAVMRAVTSLALLAAPLAAQRPGVQASARFGLSVPSDDYAADCGDPSLALSVDVQGKGRMFPQLSLDRFTGSGGGGDDLCIPVLPTLGTAVGGLRLDGATRVGLGAGARLGRGIVQLEVAALGGFVTGRRGFDGAGTDDERAVLPHVGAQAAIVLARHLVLSGAVHWTRLSLAMTPVGGGRATTRRRWSAMSTMQVGARVGFGR